MILFDSLVHLGKLKQLFLERMELPEDVREVIEKDMLLDPIQWLGSDDSVTEKTIELDDYTGMPGIDEEEEKRLDPTLIKKPSIKQKVRRDDVDIDETGLRPPSPTHSSRPLISKWDKTFAEDDNAV